MSEKVTVAARPCGSCPYRRDVPSGVWAAHEYDKLVDYDQPTWAQPPILFMCHQRDGCVCAGWLACHGGELLALRIGVFSGAVQPALFEYTTDVPVFASGAAAAAHGKRDVKRPNAQAQKLVAKLGRLTAPALALALLIFAGAADAQTVYGRDGRVQSRSHTFSDGSTMTQDGNGRAWGTTTTAPTTGTVTAYGRDGRRAATIEQERRR
jgi:hypothetical protein